ncbi:hypothetical protein [Rhizobium sp. WL3]|nr:hypothetical protein [Rhizobium sp. WL3]
MARGIESFDAGDGQYLVIALIFSFFAILREYLHRVLVWGIRFCNHW